MIRFASPCIAALLLAVPAYVAAEQCNFTVSGNVNAEIDSRLAKLHQRNNIVSLPGVMVRVSGRRGGPFVEWGTVTTGPAGTFAVTQSRRCGSKHQFRVEVKFKSNEVMIVNNGVARWYRIFQDADEREDTSRPLGTLTFAAGAAVDLGDELARAHAQLWTLAQLTRQTLDSLGQGFGSRRVKIHYPTVLPTHADVLNNDVYVQRRPNKGIDDLFNGAGESFVVHEIMHVWAYLHTRPLAGGEVKLIFGLPGGTHQRRELIGTAFNEGFAEYAKDKLFETMFADVPVLPFTRTFLSCDSNHRLVTLDDVQHNDDGWTSILHTLTTPELHNSDFGLATPCPGQRNITPISGAPLSGCTSPSVQFRQILELFDRHPPQFPHKLALRDMDLNGFLDRAITVIGGDLTGKAQLYRAVASPGATQQPRDFLCQ